MSLATALGAYDSALGRLAPIPTAWRDRLTDDQVESLTDEADDAARAEQIELARHALRKGFEEAIAWSDAASTPRVPVAEAGRIVQTPITELVGLLQDSHWFVQACCTALRRGKTESLMAEMVDTYLDANVAALVALGWSAEA